MSESSAVYFNVLQRRLQNIRANSASFSAIAATWARKVLTGTVSRNIAWLLADKLQRLMFGLLVGIWVARYLGPSNFGLLSFATAMTALSGSLASLGLDLVVVRQVVRRPDESDVVLGTAFWLKTAGAAFSFAIALAVGALLLPVESVDYLLLVIVSASLLFKPFDVIDFFFQAKVLSKYAVMARGVAFLLSSAGKIFLVILSAPVYTFAVVIAVETVLSGICLWFAYRLHGNDASRWRFDMAAAKKLLGAGLPGIGSALSVVLYMKIDQVMLGKMTSAYELGNYSVATRLSEVTYFLPVIVTGSLLPSLVKLRKDGAELYSKRLQQLYDAMVVSSVLLMIPFSLSAPYIVDFLYGTSYALAGEVLQVYSWSFLFIALSVTTGKWLYAEDLVPYNFLLQSLGAITNILLNLYLIPRMGATGAALATIVSYSAAAYLGLLPFRATRPAFVRITKALLLPVRFAISLFPGGK